MGKRFNYCSECETVLTRKDFNEGLAVEDGDRAYCLSCAENISVDTASSAKNRQVTPDSLARKTARVSKSAGRRRTTRKIPREDIEAEMEAQDEDRPRRNRGGLDPTTKKAAIIGGMLLGMSLIIVLLIMLKGGDDDLPDLDPGTPPIVAVPRVPDPDVSKNPEPAGPRKPGPGASRDDMARYYLDLAKEYARENPGDEEGQLNAYKKIAWDYDKTPAAIEAKTLSDAIVKRQTDRFREELASLDGRIEGPISREQFRQAEDLLEVARKIHKAPQWEVSIGNKVREVQDRAFRAFQPLKQEAIDAAGRGDKETLARIRERVEGWGYESYLKELAMIAGGEPVGAVSPSNPSPAADPATPAPEPIPEPPTERSAAGKAYLAAWERAMIHATQRNFNTAVEQVKQLVEDASEDAVKTEAQGDVRILQDLAGAYGKAVDALSKAERGKRIVLAYRDAAGKVVPAAGAVVQSNEHRIEVLPGSDEETVFVEFKDATGASLGAAPGLDGRARALLCLADGAAEEAKAAGAGGIPRKYWEYAATAREKLPEPNLEARRVEHEIRSIFYAAEREYRDMATRASAVQKYKNLAENYVASSFVIPLINHITRRSKAGRDYYFTAGDLYGDGSFELDKTHDAWVAKNETEMMQARENYVEFEFAALPDTEYRCWMYLGGCCLEVFQIYWQATDMMQRHPKTRKEIEVAVGSAMAIPLKLRPRGLKREHKQHSKDEAKTPEKWAWYSIPIPRYKEPGVKGVRLMTFVQGFGVGKVIVSSTLDKTPTEEIEKDFIALRELDPPVTLPEVGAVGGLVAMWAFDEDVTDVSGSGHDGNMEENAKLAGNGKIGKALRLDGNKAHVEVPDAKELNVTGDLTLALWAKREAGGNDYMRLVGKGGQDDRTYGIWIHKDGKLMYQHYAGKKQLISLTPGVKLQGGKWTHIAAVVSGKDVRLYVNGEERGQGELKGTPTGTSGPFRIGYPGMHAGFKGLIDDVRLYNRAFSAAEVKELMAAGG